MTNNINMLLEKLKKVSPKGKGQWMACCPAHEDRSPSLAIKETSDGRILVKCFAGCGAADIVAAAGLTLADLFPDGGSENFHPFAFARVQRKEEASRQEAMANAKLSLDIAEAMRQRGEKLSQADLDRELQAYKTLKGL